MVRRTLLWLSRRRSLSRFAGGHRLGRAVARRRLAERPANLAFVATSVVNEAVARR